MVAAAALRGPPESTREPLVSLVRVSKEYDTGGGVVQAMREVSLSIAQGEFVAIVGTSGSGKSTMMNILGCLDRPTRGRYVLSGIDVGERTGDSRAIVRNRVIGFIFQGFNLLPRTTALENCELPLQYRGVGARQRHARAKAALAAVGLADRMDHTSSQLSGGQQQRVAIARALVTDPPLLLADEPTGNLDTRTSLEVLALLQRLNRERGITIVLVTHDHDIAACASRIITMRDGFIVSDAVQPTPTDAAAELAKTPAADSSDASVRSDAGDADSSVVLSRERIPLRIYGALFVGSRLGLLGARLFFALAGVAVGTQMGLVAFSQAAGLLCEAWVGASSARRALGHPPTSEQRARIALWYTTGTGVGAALLVLLLTVSLPFGLDQAFARWSLLALLTERTPGHAPAVILAAGLGFLAALALLRYLLLTLFGTARPPKAAWSTRARR
jgi:putative ABC transport system ATP-binding protein